MSSDVFQAEVLSCIAGECISENGYITIMLQPPHMMRTRKCQRLTSGVDDSHSPWHWVLHAHAIKAKIKAESDAEQNFKFANDYAKERMAFDSFLSL